MNASFLSPSWAAAIAATTPTIPTPRPVRLIKATKATKTPANPFGADTNSDLPEAVDSYMLTACRRDAQLNANLYTQEYGDDEFGDVDDEFDGLTITDAMDEVELFNFCTGYDVL